MSVLVGFFSAVLVFFCSCKIKAMLLQLQLLLQKANTPELSGHSLSSNRNLIRLAKRTILMIYLCFVFTSYARPQSEISGVIKDAKGNAINNATVVLINAFDSKEVASIISNEYGSFVFANLVVGEYTVKISAIGFESTITPMYSIISSQDMVDVGVLKLRKDARFFYHRGAQF
jgi:hypothetical protein